MPFKLPDLLVSEIRPLWERLTAKVKGVRNWLNQQNPRIIIGITCASVLVFLLVVILQSGQQKVPELEESKKSWYYDLNTGKLFVAKIDLVVPIEAPSGPLPNGSPAGVRTYVFAYGYKANESERFIGFLERPDPNAEQHGSKSATISTYSAESWGRGKLIRRVDDEQWVPADSAEGIDILKEVLLPNESGERAQYLAPE